MTKETKCVRCANGDTRTADGFHLMSTGKYKRCADLPPYEQPATPSSKPKSTRELLESASNALQYAGPVTRNLVAGWIDESLSAVIETPQPGSNERLDNEVLQQWIGNFSDQPGHPLRGLLMELCERRAHETQPGASKQNWKLSDERIGELRQQVDRLLSTMNVYECVALRDILSEELGAHETKERHCRACQRVIPWTADNPAFCAYCGVGSPEEPPVTLSPDGTQLGRWKPLNIHDDVPDETPAQSKPEKASEPQPGDVLGIARMVYTGKLPPRKLDEGWCMHLVKYSECPYGCTPENIGGKS